MICDKCPDEHTFVCNCGHQHSDHVYAGGCKILNCNCDGYDQTKQKLPSNYESVYKKGLAA